MNAMAAHLFGLPLHRRKSVERQKEAEEWRAEMESRSSEQMRDLSLKDGEKLNIKVCILSTPLIGMQEKLISLMSC